MVGCEDYSTLQPSQEPINPRNLSVGCEAILLQWFLIRLKICLPKVAKECKLYKISMCHIIFIKVQPDHNTHSNTKQSNGEAKPWAEGAMARDAGRPSCSFQESEETSELAPLWFVTPFILTGWFFITKYFLLILNLMVFEK